MAGKSSTLVLFTLIVFTAFFMRFYKLDLRPMQHDEANHWYFFINKIHLGEPLTYWPSFNGFTPWYISAIPLYFMETSIFTLRFMVALFGASTVLLLYPLRKHLGDVGLLVSASLLAVSPSMTYYSRSVMPHNFFVFFMLSSIVCAVLYLEKPRNIFLYLLSVNFALLLTTHAIALVFLAIAASFIFLLHYFDFSGRLFKDNIEYVWSKVEKKALITSAILFLVVVSMIMSSFFTNFSTLSGFMGGFDEQFYKVFNTRWDKPFFYYFSVFFPIELPIFLGSILSVLFLKRNYFSVFVSYWLLTIFFVSSVTPYKLPCIFIIVLLPMFILTGLVVDSILSRWWGVRWLRNMTVAVVLISLVFSFYTSVDLNYAHPTSKENKLNYLGPTDDVYKLIDDLNAYLRKKDARILVTATVYRPYRFHLRENKAFYLDYTGKINTTDYPEYDIFILEKYHINEEDVDPLSFEIKEYEMFEGYYNVVLFRRVR